MEIKYINNSIFIKKDNTFSLEKTFDCGQCFRFDKKENKFCGIAFGNYLEASENTNEIILHNVSKTQFNNIWRKYFDLDRDYNEINNFLDMDPVIKKAREKAAGIRILKQDPWETLCSFIISQNNNIPRIKKIVSLLCENFGEPVYGGFTFPQAHVLAKLGIGGLSVIRSGFRAKYLADASEKVASGSISLEKIAKMSFIEAKSELIKIKGIGEKVACCILLFGYGFFESFPKDVWIKRAIENHYGNSFDENIFGNYGGLAQQYLFYYERYK